MYQSELRANEGNRRQERENACEQVAIGLRVGRESGVRFFNQSQSEVKQNQSKTRIELLSIDTQLKTALVVY